LEAPAELLDRRADRVLPVLRVLDHRRPRLRRVRDLQQVVRHRSPFLKADKISAEMPTGLVPRTPPRRLVLLSVLAAALGVAGGAAAYVLVHLIALLTNLTLLHRFGWKLPSFAHHDPGPWVIPAALAGGLLVSLLAG